MYLKSQHRRMVLFATWMSNCCASASPLLLSLLPSLLGHRHPSTSVQTESLLIFAGQMSNFLPLPCSCPALITSLPGYVQNNCVTAQSMTSAAKLLTGVRSSKARQARSHIRQQIPLWLNFGPSYLLCKTSHLARLWGADKFQSTALGFLEGLSVDENCYLKRWMKTCLKCTLVKQVVSRMGSSNVL